VNGYFFDLSIGVHDTQIIKGTQGRKRLLLQDFVILDGLVLRHISSIGFCAVRLPADFVPLTRHSQGYASLGRLVISQATSRIDPTFEK